MKGARMNFWGLFDRNGAVLKFLIFDLYSIFKSVPKLLILYKNLM
jgi:hypothetical protein